VARRPRVHTAAQPAAGGPDWGYFWPASEFTCQDTGSVYMAGQRYTIRHGNAALLARVRRWSRAGKCAMALTAAAPPASAKALASSLQKRATARAPSRG